MESAAIKLSSCMTCVLHTARNSNVEVVVVNNNEINYGEVFLFQDACHTLTQTRENKSSKPLTEELVDSGYGLLGRDWCQS